MATRASTSMNQPVSSRRSMLVRMAGASAAAGVSAVGLHTVAAQDATPTGGACGAPLGAPVVFRSVEGIDLAKLTISKIADPFTGYNPAAPPTRGSRFLLISATLENVGANPWQFDPGRVFIQDADGFVTYPSNVDLGPEPAEPGIPYQEIPAAGVVSGVIGYTLVKGVAPVRVFFAPSGDRLLLLADIPA